MQQIHRRTPMPKCDFHKVAKQFYWNDTSAWVFPCKFAAYFQNTSGRQLLNNIVTINIVFINLLFQVDKN